MSDDGYDMLSASVTCPRCRGEKTVEVPREMHTEPDGTRVWTGSMETCSTCGGTGEVEDA